MRSACPVEKYQGIQTLISASRPGGEPNVPSNAIDESGIRSFHRPEELGGNSGSRLHPIIRAPNSASQCADDLVTAIKNVVLGDDGGATGVGAQELNTAISGNERVVEGE